MEEHLKFIASTSDTDPEDGVIAINTDTPEYPFLVYRESGSWKPIDNMNTLERNSRLDDLYSYLREIDWGIGCRVYNKAGDFWMTVNPQESSIPALSNCGGFKLSEVFSREDLEIFDNISMNKEINFYYDYLVSTRDILKNSSVIDLFSYPVEYGSILNLSELPEKRDHHRYKKSGYIIKLGIYYVKSGEKHTGELMFNPWTTGNDGEDLRWSEFTQSVDGNVIVEFHDGCIRLFPETPEITECIIHHCSAFYEGLI